MIRSEHFEVMKDGALLANSGHFDVEIDKVSLEEMSTEISQRRENIVGYRMSDGRILNLLAEGRLVNLAAGNGHPAEIMDMSFGLQALSMEYMAKHGREMEAGVYAVRRSLTGGLRKSSWRRWASASMLCPRRRKRILRDTGNKRRCETTARNRAKPHEAARNRAKPREAARSRAKSRRK